MLPPPPVPPFVLTQNRSPKEIAGSDIMKLKVSQCPPELLCSEEEITELLQTLDTSKASGQADVSTRMLRETVSAIAPSPKWSDPR